MPLHVELVAPESVLYEGEADMVVCRTTDGEIAFLPGHAPFLGALGVGEVRVLLPEGTGPGRGGEEAFSVDGGFVEVHEDKVTVLSDAARLEEASEAGDQGEAPPEG